MRDEHNATDKGSLLVVLYAYRVPTTCFRNTEVYPTDEDIDFLYNQYAVAPNKGYDPVQWGDSVTWSEFHHQTRYPYAFD